MKQNLPISNKERDYAETANILSTTNLKGAITYYNDDFLAISGFEPEELMHNNHNVVRHPEMPPAAFEDLWKTIKDGNSWMGIVKNRCKNGDHYWVDAYVTPIRSNGQIVEYQSVRQKPAREYVNRAEKIYKSLLAGQLPKEISPSRFSIGTRIIAAVTSSLLVSFLLLTLLFDVEASSAIAGFSISAILASRLASLVLRPLKSAIEKAKCITDNPIARYVYTGRNDDVGALLLAIKSLGSEIGGFIGRISDDSKKLSECAETLSETIETSNQGVQQQYSETDQVATAINEMSVSIQEVASNAQLTADAASHATAESESGMDIVKSTTSSIEELANGLEQASGVIAKVETDSAEISSIVDVIRSISEQTNLLALNAAIEAARAGEYGRGFAVVADEVRNLAGRTNSATGEIQNMIEQLQSGTSKAVSVMSKSREQAVNSVKQANSAAQSLESITNAIININDMSMTIASAVEEQSAVAEDINRSITTIRDTAENTMRGSLQTEEAGTAMANLARSLKELADEFWTKKSNC